ncbi:alpha/beta-hydrolase [Microthyrium microscopicum]|uniref:Alpha/beta-hydrolase n=1 Tax=Microthyrium microscopicum TaxID=703497 RepID=A0A6A6UAK3_9PEZI|nr:alpha/beta-hydrolase [Microthyrium microscopicum]
MALSLLRGINSWLRFSIDAVFAPLPFKYRWRLLLLQPVTVLTYALKTVPYLLNSPFKAEWILVEGGKSFRIIVFQSKTESTELKPLHVSIHGGAFLGGLPEYNAELCEQICTKTGAVVISISYRYAPKYPFPAAIDDVDAIMNYLKDNAATKYGANPELITLSGLSAGGNLALATTLQPHFHSPSPTSIKGAVTFYASIDLRLKPDDKPKPPGFPPKDPSAVFMPLFDSYPGPVRFQNMDNPRLNPILAPIDKLPENLLLIIPTVDILLHEQLTFLERVQEEAAGNPKHKDRQFKAILIEGQFHGWAELPSFNEKMRGSKNRAFNACVDFIANVHQKYGVVNEES